jgi:membrane protein required for colicin V production
MNVLDWVLVGVGAFWVLRGLVRGAISQVFGIAGIFAGFFVACHNFDQVSALINKNFPSFTGSGPVAFILLFILTWFCISVVGFWIVRIIRSAGLGFLDRLWGGMIGFGKALLFAIATISILTLFSVGGNPTLLTHSALVPYIKEASSFMFKIAPVKVQGEFSKKQQNLEQFLAEKTAFLLETLAGGSGAPKGKSERKRD